MPMLPSDPFGGAADRIRQMQQARMMSEPKVQAQFDLDMSPHETDSAPEMPSQAEMDDITRHVQANYAYNPDAAVRDRVDGSISFGPQFARTRPNYAPRWKRAPDAYGEE